MNKIDRHYARLMAANRVYQIELETARRLYQNAVDLAEIKYKMTRNQALEQMEREPND